MARTTAAGTDSHPRLITVATVARKSKLARLAAAAASVTTAARPAP
jgi:hypothetical protein